MHRFDKPRNKKENTGMKNLELIAIVASIVLLGAYVLYGLIRAQQTQRRKQSRESRVKGQESRGESQESRGEGREF